MQEKVIINEEKYKYVICQGYIHKIPLNNEIKKEQEEHKKEKLNT